MSARILIADDDKVSRQLFAETLEKEGYRVDRARSGDEVLSILRDELYELLIIDVRMPGMTGLEVTRILHEKHSPLPIIVMTAFGSIETAVEAIHEGAFDFISKPMNLEELKKTVSRALAQRAIQDRGRTSGEETKDAEQPGTIIGKSSAMVEVYKTVARVAPTKSAVLILGESGTGKELIAKAIHQHSPRASRPFVAVDCGALSETLLESELFGHVRGAFTGAVTDKRGVFEEAQGGTCFLDEIGDISTNMQAKLLRVLQEHEVRRVGGRDWVKVDVRVVAATNQNLDELVRKGTFRQDLYYRLNVVAIHLPPLRNRVEDIPFLAGHFLKRYSQENGKSITAISDKSVKLLCAYSWPGNIRELENEIEQAVALSNQPVLTRDDLPAAVRNNAPSKVTDDLSQNEQFLFSDTPTLDEVKKRYVLHVLRSVQGNVSRAAKVLNIDRRSLYRMLARYEIEHFS
jgi:two-component system, NtrC family, response regulator AtoC